MRHTITYITADNKEFDNQFEAKKHECLLTSHNWSFYDNNGSLQKEENEKTQMKFCKKCNQQSILK